MFEEAYRKAAGITTYGYTRCNYGGERRQVHRGLLERLRW